MLARGPVEPPDIFRQVIETFIILTSFNMNYIMIPFSFKSVLELQDRNSINLLCYIYKYIRATIRMYVLFVVLSYRFLMKHLFIIYGVWNAFSQNLVKIKVNGAELLQSIFLHFSFFNFQKKIALLIHLSITQFR